MIEAVPLDVGAVEAVENHQRARHVTSTEMNRDDRQAIIHVMMINLDLGGGEMHPSISIKMITPRALPSKTKIDATRLLFDCNQDFMSLIDKKYEKSRDSQTRLL